MTNTANPLVLLVLEGLAAVAIVGGVGLAIAQSTTQKQVETNTAEIVRQRAAAEAVPVIQSDIRHMKDDLEEVKDDVDEIKQGIAEIKAAVAR